MQKVALDGAVSGEIVRGGGGRGKQVVVHDGVRGCGTRGEGECTADGARHVNAFRAKQGGEPERNTCVVRKNVVIDIVACDSELFGMVHIWYVISNDGNISDKRYSKVVIVSVEDAESGGPRRKFIIVLEYVECRTHVSKNNQKCRI
jgi:hypothetical protein